jgi:hypothetical protein
MEHDSITLEGLGLRILVLKEMYIMKAARLMFLRTV